MNNQSPFRINNSEKGMNFMDLRAMQFAHDLKMPIQLIYSCIQLLEMELSPNARAEGYLDMLLRSANQLQSMVSGALDGRESCETCLQDLKICDVVQHARSVSRACAIFAGERDVRLHFDTNAARFLMPTDSGKLERMLNNLVSNALRFAPRGGHVGVSVRVRGDAVEFSVSDDGCGIPENRQQAIFENGVTEGGHGYGLGIVRDLARSLGGDVGVQSAPGRGSCFTLRLPVLNPVRA